jgi:hypothetical protein
VVFPGGGTVEHGAVRDVPKIAAEYYAIGVPPAHGLFARNVRGLTLNNVRFELAAPDQRPAVIFDHVSDATVNALAVRGDPKAESVLRFIDSTDVLVSAARVLAPTAPFLQVEGTGSERIVLDGGELSRAEAPVVLKAGATDKAVRMRA